MKVVQIPEEKNKLNVLDKVKKFYNTDLTRGKRQARRLRDEANFAALQFMNTIVILKTEGEEKISKFGEFLPFEKVVIKLSDCLGIFAYRINDKKISLKISRETYLDFKGNYELAFKNNSGFKFKNLQKKWASLPHYVGIGEQRKNLLVFLRELKKKYSRKWDLDYTK